MKRNLPVLVPIMFAMVVMIYGASRKSRPSTSQTAESTSYSHAQSKPAPDFKLNSLEGRTVHLSDYRGKAVVLNFWATYCAPCRVEMPWLIDFYRQYKAQGLEIIGVSMDDGGQQQVEDFVKEMNVNYTILMGDHSVGDAYGGLRFLPQTFLIDPEGRIVKSMLGVQSKSDFRKSLELIAK